MITDARREALRLRENRRRDLEDVRGDSVCAQCGGMLGMWPQADGEWLLACMADRSHLGYRRLRSLTERYYAGEVLPLGIIDSIKRRRKA